MDNQKNVSVKGECKEYLEGEVFNQMDWKKEKHGSSDYVAKVIEGQEDWQKPIRKSFFYIQRPEH